MPPETGAVVDLESDRECGPSSPVGVVADAGNPGAACPAGEVVLSVRGASCIVSAGPPNGSTALGDGPRGPAPIGALELADWSRGDSSPENPGLITPEDSPYRARCWRAIRSRRPSSLKVLGLMERSDLLEAISARRPGILSGLKSAIGRRLTSVVLLLLVVVAQFTFSLCGHASFGLHHLVRLAGTPLKALVGVEV